MMLPSLASFVLAAALSLSDPFSFEYNGQTDENGKAYVIIVANQNMESIDVKIEGDGKTIKKTLSMGKGSREKIAWKQSSQQARYEMEIRGSGMSADFAFEVAKAPPKGAPGKLTFKSSREDVVDRHQATYRTPFALTSYEYKVFDNEGDIVDSKVVGDGVAANSEFTIHWNSPVPIFMIEVRGEDQYGRFVEDRRVPYSVAIPHTEVNFDSGKSDIKPGEVPKLDEALAVAFHELDALDRVNKAVNANLTPQLYIVGYTDTVGPTASNDKLSDSRAKAIAKYFYDQGFWAEIYYAGRGERALRVETGDNVDEVRNRRALYLIALQKPAGGGQIPSRWSKLAGPRQRPASFTLPPLPEKWKDYRSGGSSHEGGSASGGDGGAAGGDEGGIDSSDTFGEFNDSSSDPGGDDDGGGYGDGGGDDGPPEVDDGPGAAKKGCSIGSEDLGPMSLGLFVLMFVPLTRRRRA